MRLPIAALILIASLLGLAGPAAAAQGPARVVPRAAEGLKPIELSALVRDLLPDKHAKALDWRHAHNLSGLRWGAVVDKGGKPDPQAAWVRVRRQGRALRLYCGGEIAWTVALMRHAVGTSGPPDQIYVGPGGEACFGTGKPSCVFSPAEAFRGAGVKAEKVCEWGWVDNRAAAYWVSAPGRRDTLVVYQTNTGSAVEEAALQLRPFADSDAVCRELGLERYPGQGPKTSP